MYQNSFRYGSSQGLNMLILLCVFTTLLHSSCPVMFCKILPVSGYFKTMSKKQIQARVWLSSTCWKTTLPSFTTSSQVAGPIPKTNLERWAKSSQPMTDSVIQEVKTLQMHENPVALAPCIHTTPQNRLWKPCAHDDTVELQEPTIKV